MSAQLQTTRSRRASGGASFDPARSRGGGVWKALGRILGITLVGIGVWGFWVSADVAQRAGVSGSNPTQVNLTALLWLVLFAPFLGAGVAIFWATFREEDDSWLAPLRAFNLIVGLKILRQTRRRQSGVEASGRTIPSGPSGEPKRLGSGGDAAGQRKSPF